METILIKIVIGAVIGSFLYCVRYRIRNGISMISTNKRSFCDACGTNLTPIDLIPIIVPVVNKGKCRHCGNFYGYGSMWNEILFATGYALVPDRLFLLIVPISITAYILCAKVGYVILKREVKN